MTRDEAEIAARGILSSMDRDMDPNIRMRLLVDGFVSLGILHLDGPRRTNLSVTEAVHMCRMTTTHEEEFIKSLDRCGFKIVEK